MIANRRELARFHGDRCSRLVLAALEVAVKSVMPNVLVTRAVSFEDRLSVRDIQGNVVRLEGFDRVFIVGAGKAAAGMAGALHSILGGKVTGGAITVPYGVAAKIKGISVTQASHPVPNSSGVIATKKILTVLSKARRRDLVFVVISGGGSALMPLPATGISLSDKQKITNQLLRSGASIHEVNAVRKHLSAVKGGQLLSHVDPSCTIVSLIISDVIGDDLEVISSGPTCPDSTTFQDALKILKKYHIKSSDQVLDRLIRGTRGMIKDTPKQDDPVFSRVHNMLIGNNAISCAEAARYLKKSGLKTVLLGSEFDGEASDFGRFLARLSSDLGKRPFALVAGGETTVRLTKSGGVGGRNQEAALAYIMEIRGHASAAFMGTDGRDGNSDAAGALISPKTISLAKKINLDKYLSNHDSYHAFEKMNSLIFTGYTGTNVNDIAIVCAQPQTLKP